MQERPPRRQTAMTTIGGQLVLSERLALFRRMYRWLNLTLIQQAIWPLLLVLASAPPGDPERTPFLWYLARIGAPTAAALLAWLYVRQQTTLAPGPSPAKRERGDGRFAPLRAQARFLLLGLPLMVAAARLIDGPTGPATKLMALGVAEVAAYHLIHFGVVVRSYRDPLRGLAVATILFGASWGLHDALLVALGPNEGSSALAFLGGGALGLLVAGCSRLLRRWPGGALPAAAAHWLIIYGILGFAG